MKIRKRIFLSMLFLPWFLYSHSIFALVAYDELRLLGLVDGSTQNITHPTIGGSFEYDATDPYGFDGDNGTIIKAVDGGYWIRQFTYDLSNPIELDWFEPDQNSDLTQIIQNLAVEKNGVLYLKAPSISMTLSASTATFTEVDIQTFHLIESNVPLTVALSGRRLFSQNGSIDANDPNDLDRLVWQEDLTVPNRWHADLSAIAISEPIQNLWAEEPDGKLMHWGTPVSAVSNVTAVSGKEIGHMRWYSDAVTLTVAAAQSPAVQFPQLQVSPDSYVQMWNFVGPEEIVLGGPQRNITFTGAYRAELSSMGAWNYAQNYRHVGGHGRAGPVGDADGNNVGLIGFRPRGSSTTDRAEVRANIDQCFSACINVQGSASSVSGNGLDAFEGFVLDGTVNTNGARFNSGIVHLHFEDVWISDPWSTGAGWSGEAFPDNWDRRLYGSRPAGFSTTFIREVTGQVTLQYGGGGFDFGPRNGTYSHAVDLIWQGSAPGILQATLADPVTELWTLTNSLGPMTTSLAKDGDWQWSNGQLQVYSDGTLSTDSLTAVHQRLSIRYKDIGWSESGTRSDYKHFSFKVDHTGTANLNQSFIQFGLLPGDFGTFGIRGAMVKLEATNENGRPVWNLTDEPWSQDATNPNLWTLPLPDSLVVALVLIGDGRVLASVPSVVDLTALGIVNGQWHASPPGSTLTMYADQNPSVLFDQLIGGQGSYKNEYHNIALDGLDAVHDYNLSDNPSADIQPSILEEHNGQDYSQPHTFVGALDGSIAMHSGTLNLHEYLKVSGLLGYNIHVQNTPHTTDASVDFGAAFTRYGRGNEIKDVTLNGQLTLAGGSRENTADNLRFIGLPRPVIRILNDPADPITEISLSNVQAPDGASIEAESTANVEVKLDGTLIQLPYYFGTPQQPIGNTESINSNSWALYHLDGSISNEVPGNPFTSFWNNTTFVPVIDANLPGFQMASENGGFAARYVSMDAFNNGINVSFWAALAPQQLGLWAELVMFQGSDQDIFRMRIREGKELVVTVGTIDGSQSHAQNDFADITNALDGKLHRYQFAFNPSGDRRIRIAIDGVLRWVSAPIVGSAVWRHVDDLEPGETKRGRMGVFCSWSGCGGNQTQGVIDEVHIQQCDIGDIACSKLSSLTTIESIQDLDGDDMLDSWEQLYSLDPSNPTDASLDADNDGLQNSDEFIAGTNPLVTDTDGDGHSDGDEVAAGSDPLNTASFPATTLSAPLMGTPVLILLALILCILGFIRGRSNRDIF